MRIAINAITLLGDRTGVGTYTRNLIRALAETDPYNEYLLYFGHSRPHVLPGPAGSNFSNVQSRLPGRIRRFAFETCGLPIEWLVGAVDVVHEPFIFGHRTRRARRVITLFDLIPLRFPELFAEVLRAGWAFRVRKAVGRADSVITVSKASKADIQERLGVRSDKIRVIPLAPAPEFQPGDRELARATVRARLGLQGRIVLHVGRMEPHKNLVRLVDAFGRAHADLGGLEELVFTGPAAGPCFQKVSARAQELRIEHRVHFVEYLPIHALVDLVNAAEVVVIPSLWEGFGLPVLEAMACGTPVITSAGGATAEVADQAAWAVDPGDTQSIADALLQLLSREDLRATLIQRGLRRASRFSWHDVARRTLNVYTDQ